MPTATKSALAELKRLERVRDEAHDEARSAHAKIEAFAAERLSGGLIAVAPPPELEAAWGEARDRYHREDIAVWRFKVDNARALLAEMVPDRDRAAVAVLEALEQLRAAIRGYRGVEHQLMAGLKTVGLSGADLVTDRRVDHLASGLDPFDLLEEITAPYSRSAETPEGHLPLFKPNDDRDGWVS